MKSANALLKITAHSQAVPCQHSHGQVREDNIEKHSKAGCFGVRGYNLPLTPRALPPPAGRVRSNFLHTKNEKYTVKIITDYLNI